MEVAKCFVLLVGVLLIGASSSHAYDFYVGGRDGWVLNPSESYSLWAARNRFQVNDTLVFNYTREENSVLRVTKEDYDACNVGNPILRMDGGNSIFIFNQSGPFYFISGVPQNCDRGQKLPVVVMAVRNKTPSIPPADHSPSTPPIDSSAPSPLATPSPHAQAPPDSSSSTGTSPPPSGSAAHSSSSSSSSSSSVFIASRVALGLAMGLVLAGALLN